ncbi:hypothetical protein ABI_13090 [Asticcacaulis biprosthecium C19]|uniref:Uncharacterized protein n=1 Tax=Asticcacaulis biprosthecium C19 TaxID=715226 RepID=F4QI04_9CAUL|nr:hypothetical protein ABI_13090 [Asticcacaulis biprosthecium C19]
MALGKYDLNFFLAVPALSNETRLPSDILTDATAKSVEIPQSDRTIG